ncbi:protein phosphatase 1A-like isoform X2 [Oscarella lobularis]|uniref:protein phosphatase 1A-like isoform X2 n=1 Tax=Oscarella lobularis TaxID=121494 RepID=UPI0033140562
MGAFLQRPVTSKYTEMGAKPSSNLRYAVASMQGYRSWHEDVHAVVLQPEKFEDWAYFAVFDGHAGQRCAQLAAEDMLDYLLHELDASGAKANESETREAIVAGFLSLDTEIMKKQDQLDTSGSTAIACFVTTTHIVFINCGDSRAVLCGGDGLVSHATIDHKPTLPEERERIKRAGGTVTLSRINNTLSLSRGLGDKSFKMNRTLGQTEQMVSPVPVVDVRERRDDDQFVIIACDGIWDVMENQEAVDFVAKRMQIVDDLTKVASDMVDECLYRGSKDNMTVIIVAFQSAPKLSARTIEEEAKKEDKIKKEMIEAIRDELKDKTAVDAVDEYMIMTHIRHELPPDYDLCGKLDFAREQLEKCKKLKAKGKLGKKLVPKGGRNNEF